MNRRSRREFETAILAIVRQQPTTLLELRRRLNGYGGDGLVLNFVGRRFAVVIPFEADGVKNEYTFWFKIDDAAIKALEQP